MAWHHREVSARKSKGWIKELASICAETKSQGATLAASSVCRLLRNRHNVSVIEESGVSLLMCDNDGIDANTAKGRHRLAAAVNDAHYEADVGSERVKAALKVAKDRGQLLGTHNPRVKNKGAKALKKAALDKARALKTFVQKLMNKGYGRRRLTDELNEKPWAVKVNGASFTLATTQRIMKRVKQVR